MWKTALRRVLTYYRSTIIKLLNWLRPHNSGSFQHFHFVWTIQQHVLFMLELPTFLKRSNNLSGATATLPMISRVVWWAFIHARMTSICDRNTRVVAMWVFYVNNLNASFTYYGILHENIIYIVKSVAPSMWDHIIDEKNTTKRYFA